MQAVTGWPGGYGRIILAEADSTNAEALRRAPGLDRPTWIMAERQTAGRGRRGRAWSDPEGNFAASLLLFPSEPLDRVALRSYVAALALHQALVDLTGRAEGLALKWPNDVLLNGGKLAGILLESSGSGVALDQLVIGIGVNLRSAPAAPAGAGAAEAPGTSPPRPVSLLSERGIDPGPEEVLTALARSYADWEARFAAEGFAPVREAWLARAARLGETVTARGMRDSVQGRFEGIDDRGNLLLATGDGLRAIPAADVYF